MTAHDEYMMRLAEKSMMTLQEILAEIKALRMATTACSPHFQGKFPGE